jgi:hypothetical protein
MEDDYRKEMIMAECLFQSFKHLLQDPGKYVPEKIFF